MCEIRQLGVCFEKWGDLSNLVQHLWPWIGEANMNSGRKDRWNRQMSLFGWFHHTKRPCCRKRSETFDSFSPVCCIGVYRPWSGVHSSGMIRLSMRLRDMVVEGKKYAKTLGISIRVCPYYCPNTMRESYYQRWNWIRGIWSTWDNEMVYVDVFRTCGTTCTQVAWICAAFSKGVGWYWLENK